MPGITDFLKKETKKKTSGKSKDWDISQFNSPTPQKPQRRPGRGSDQWDEEEKTGANPQQPIRGTTAYKTRQSLPKVAESRVKAPSPQTTSKTPLALQEINPSFDTDHVTISKPETHSKGIAALKNIETKWRQTRDKLETQPKTKWRQTEDKLKTKKHAHQTGKKQTRDKVETQLETQLKTKWRQTEDKVETNTAFQRLVGLRRTLINILYREARTNGSKRTYPLSVQHISERSEASVSSVKKTLQRLERESWISRPDFKNGRSGWTIYELTEHVYRDLLQLETEDKLETKWRQTRDKVGTQVETQVETRVSSSSRDLKETTTTEEPKLIENERTQLSPEWAEVEYESLAGIGFRQSHLIQLIKAQEKLPHENRLNARDVENSIKAFAFDLRVNKKGREIRTSALNYFMGMLRKGTPYGPPENYRSDEDIERERYMKQLQAIHARRAARSNKIKVLEGNLGELTREEQELLQENATT